MELSATARLIVQRLRLFEDYLGYLDACEGHSIDDWRGWARAARKSPRKSKLRREFRKRCRASKKRWFPFRDFVNRQMTAIRLIEDRTLAHGGAAFAQSPQAHSGHWESGEGHTVLTAVRKCWIFGTECVEPARDGVLLIIDALHKLAPARDLMNAIARSASTVERDPRLFNGDGSMKEGPLKILKALNAPRAKVEGIRNETGFSSVATVSEFTPAMREAGWIVRGRGGVWRRTRSGTGALRRAERGQE